ncbi:uncharacterized protein L3040_004296 [Drepanopeziza brunnea f. sp. 'multigermtubi']|uniref:GTPase binding protein Rid1 n=1 Tax=Marssonina brunnea f. sp. multigermtubi (strain MB_m1) TaxID=1072389 RepID=K1X5M2_MARBU|nr:GTPase binding protein Rid1 [Drepanopeziza brunnea f. sp. 'multigermtubi' MB_m1]EKD20417.1 GTPase binding protein Rid1 [Drepanopeziza brunnea f. sp. 'multigermtubi' MB_m1]KAJ5042905.1 hypothetical protein L3040_004296 [Drepanopeziza brunnea f. sp. 'multigermtubi']
MASQQPQPDSYHHIRPKSSSVLSFMHKRTPSAGTFLPPNESHESVASPVNGAMPFLPHDHPHARALGEIQQNQQSSMPPISSNKLRDGSRPSTMEEKPKSLHKKTLSSISLKSLAGRDSDKATKSKESKPKPKKMKSSTNLASLLKRPKSSRSLHKEAQAEAVRPPKDKENRSPVAQDSAAEAVRLPIYAQFSSEHLAKQPLGGKVLEDEIDLYTPQNYCPGKQRNFYQGPGQQPTLITRDDPAQRPRKPYLPSSFSVQDITRKVSSGSRKSAELMRRVSSGKRPSFEKKITGSSSKSELSDRAGPSKGQRVLAAVSALGGGRSQKSGAQSESLQDRDVDREFEAMLDRRNIPEHQRGKMRNLAMSMKKDFIKQDWAEIAAAKNGRPGTDGSDSSADATNALQAVPEVKVKRPRSRTFTLSRASSKEPTSPTKKSKPEGSTGKHSRTKSSDSGLVGAKSLTATGVAAAQSMIAKAKGQTPDDFVSYLRKVQKPELVEVGRLHKLRLLLRNETVAWTDGFIGQGGMEEIVGLLHRTMEVEWREEHEDALLHEVLLCLKALSTTALALHHLEKIQHTLFPALLHMIFDEEKKGPSEFTTRNIVSSLLFTYLKSAPIAERTFRAMTILSYLKDPEPTESQRPVGFVLDMRRPRPYRVWCKEVVNVTKEVFWIFLHNLNVISLPGARHHDSETMYETSDSTIASLISDPSFDISNPHHVFMARHFPQELPPVPAAPYVGGVEWDATNYLASHLDLVNGIISCLPTREERNTLREQMLVSGWEKCFGGTLRLCKEKFYGGVHAGLRCWVAAAVEDGWDTRDVRNGPSVEPRSPVKSPKKASAPLQPPPKIDMKLDFSGEHKKKPVSDDLWL